MRAALRLTVVGALLTAAAQAAPPASLTNARLETITVDPARGGLATALRSVGQGPVWAAWTVPIVAGQGDVCCWNGHGGRGPARRGCHLEREHRGLTISGLDELEKLAPAAPQRLLYIFTRLEAGEATRIRTVTASCPVDADGARVAWLDGVGADESVDFLRRLAAGGERRKGRDAGEEALGALALHAGPRADQAVIDLTGPKLPHEVREDAIFWLGEARGRAGYETLRRLAAQESDEEILEKVAFALAQSPVPEAGPELAELARGHRSAEVREQALFWVAQRGDPDAAAILLRAVAEDRDAEVREHAVFALSQLEEGGVDHLIRLLREGPSNEVRKQAFFWLAQSDDPRAMEYLERVLLK